MGRAKWWRATTWQAWLLWVVQWSILRTVMLGNGVLRGIAFGVVIGSTMTFVQAVLTSSEKSIPKKKTTTTA